MIKINLLPYREKRKKAGVQRQVVVIAAALILFLVGVLVLHFTERSATVDLRQKVTIANAKLSSLSRVAGEIDRVKADKDVLEKKIAIIKNLEANRLKPVIILDDLTSLIPPGQLWLTSLSLTDNDCKIEGLAKDNGAVAQFMKNIERSIYFKTVDLMASKQSLLGTNKLQAFTVLCSFKKGS